jgi:hypothetical protein
MAILTLRNLDGGTEVIYLQDIISKHEHCSKDDGQPLTVILHGSKSRPKLGLVSELAATAHLNFFRLRLFLQSTKSVQGAPSRYRIATALRSILLRLLHNFRDVPAFTAWIEIDEGLLPFWLRLHLNLT